jgi:hypothetical protein
VLRIDVPLTDAARADLTKLMASSDPSFGQAVRLLLAQRGPILYAEACVGLEQLTEIPAAVTTIDATARTVTWKGPIAPDQADLLTKWIKTSLFQTTLGNLLNYASVQTYPVDPKNPVQGDTTLPPDRLRIAPDRLVWSQRLTTAATPAEIAALTTLKAKAGLPVAVVQAIDALITDVSTHAKVTAVVPIAEKFWTLRPTQATLPTVAPSLKDVLLVGNNVLAFRGLMTRQEGTDLQGLAGLTAPDRLAVAYLFLDSLTAGLGGGKLSVRARRGSSGPQTSAIDPALGTGTPAAPVSI